MLSILFMRFYRNHYVAKRLVTSDFQFSLWDSIAEELTSKGVECSFQFSLWDSFYFKRVIVDRFKLSILFMRFKNWRWCRKLTLWKQLSILFMRFPYCYSLKLFWKLAFNSLYEIPGMKSKCMSHQLQYFQFSLWDSWKRSF